MRPLCQLDGCDEQVAHGRAKFCGPEHARAARVDRQRRTRAERRSQSRPLCQLDGCDLPVAPFKSKWCSPEHARRGVLVLKSDPDRTRWAYLALDNIDEVAVLRALRGERANLNRGERRRVVEVLTRRGASAHVIAERVGATYRTVVRDRTALRHEKATA